MQWDWKVRQIPLSDHLEVQRLIGMKPVTAINNPLQVFYEGFVCRLELGL